MMTSTGDPWLSNLEQPWGSWKSGDGWYIPSFGYVATMDCSPVPGVWATSCRQSAVTWDTARPYGTPTSQSKTPQLLLYKKRHDSLPSIAFPSNLNQLHVFLYCFHCQWVLRVSTVRYISPHLNCLHIIHGQTQYIDHKTIRHLTLAVNQIEPTSVAFNKFLVP